MLKWNLTREWARRGLALAVVVGAGAVVIGAHAQTPAQTTAAEPSFSAQTPAVSSASTPLFSSSSDENASAPTTLASLTPGMAFAEPMQYGGGQRSRYGRPRYRGSNSNADGSEKYIFYGGAGFTQPVGNTYRYLTPSWAVQVGGGRQFNKHFAVPIEFDWDEFGFTKLNLDDESYIYTGDGNPSDNGIDANSHIWSFSIDPRYNFMQGEKWGAYGLIGVGFYHKVGNLTAPQEEEYYDPFYGPEVFEVQGNFAHYTSNAPGFAGGVGVTYKFSHFSNEAFYAEARYVYIDNSQRYGATVANAATYTGYDGYPANSNRTSYFPIKFGIRF
jgi:hypothetical protein